MAVVMDFNHFADMGSMSDWFSACDSPSDMDLCVAQDTMATRVPCHSAVSSACTSPASTLFDSSSLHGVSTEQLNLFSYPKVGTSILSEMLFSVPMETNVYQVSPPASPAHLMEFNVDGTDPRPPFFVLSPCKSHLGIVTIEKLTGTKAPEIVFC